MPNSDKMPTESVRVEWSEAEGGGSKGLCFVRNLIKPKKNLSGGAPRYIFHYSVSL